MGRSWRVWNSDIAKNKSGRKHIWKKRYQLHIKYFVLIWIFSRHQAALWTFFSVRPSIRPPVTPFSCHRIIMKLSVIAMDKSGVHTKGQGQGVKGQGQRGQNKFCPNFGFSGAWLQFEFTDGYEMVQIARNSIDEVPYYLSRLSVKIQGHIGQKSPILTQIVHFRTVTPVKIHQWLRNDVQRLKYVRRCALLFFKVIVKFQGRTGRKIADFDPYWAFPDCNSSSNSPMAT